MSATRPTRPDLDPDPTKDIEMARDYTLTTGDDDYRGEVHGTRADAVQTANVLRERDRSGTKVYVQPADTVVDLRPAR